MLKWLKVILAALFKAREEGLIQEGQVPPIGKKHENAPSRPAR